MKSVNFNFKGLMFPAFTPFTDDKYVLLYGFDVDVFFKFNFFSFFVFFI